MLVELTPANFEYGSASVHGDDLRFVATDEAKTPLDYDIDTFTPGGTSVIWVFVPQILAAPAAHTTFWLYSDNANASASASPQNETEYTMVTTAGSAGSIVTVHGVQAI